MNTTSPQHRSRRQFLTTAGGVALLGLTAAAAASTASATPVATGQATAGPPVPLVVDYLKQWMFDANHPAHTLLAKKSFTASPGRNYNLKNLRLRKYLQWEKQARLCVDLGWTDNATPATATKVSRWFFTRPVNSNEPLRYGERLALGYGGGNSYLRYKDRPGVDLEWSKPPSFEWKLLGGPIGKPVSSQKWIAIYNQRAGDCLIHFEQTLGGHVGYPGSQTWTDQLGDILTQAVKDHWKEAVAALLTAAF